MTLNWSLSNTEGVTGYSIYYSTSNTIPATPAETITNLSTTQKEITNLVANTQYYLWLVAKGHKIYYTDSDPYALAQRTLELEKLPTPILSSPSKTSTGVTLSWSDSIAPVNGYAAVNYIISNGSTSITTTTSPYTFSGLNAGTDYRFTITAVGDNVNTKNSDTSQELLVTTNSTTALTVTYTSASNVTTTGLTAN